jgi:hypothetical protein
VRVDKVDVGTSPETSADDEDVDIGECIEMVQDGELPTVESLSESLPNAVDALDMDLGILESPFARSLPHNNSLIMKAWAAA